MSPFKSDPMPFRERFYATPRKALNSTGFRPDADVEYQRDNSGGTAG